MNRLFAAMVILAAVGLCASAQPQSQPRGWQPQAYDVSRDAASGTLTLSTPFYTFRHNLKKGGALDLVRLTYGKAENLLVSPIESGVQVAGEGGGSFTDLNDPSPNVSHERNGTAEIVTVECSLRDSRGRDTGITIRTVYEYRWGYVKIRREFLFPAKPVKVSGICVLGAIFHPSLDQYGYRQALSEQEGVSPFGFGVMQWRKMRAGTFFDPPLQTRFVPRYLALINPGVEGIEWFVSDDLSQWEYQAAGRPGTGFCGVHASTDPLGVAVSIDPLNIPGAVAAKARYVFDSRIGIPILEGHANRPWLHTSFNRNKGDWVSDEQIAKWAESGIRTVHCHNDGDYYSDGLFWRDGTYPPYPSQDMAKYDRIIERCHARGIRVATYFSNKELHPTTAAYKAHAEEWGRKPDDTGRITHNHYGNDEFGAQMCLKSGWLRQLEANVDTVLTHHRLDGVYYDWNVALACANPLHIGARGAAPDYANALGTLVVSPSTHWDIDELLTLMEWTRERVGPDGLIIVHDTMTPMFATENFANYVVGMEWGYGLLSRAVPPVTELPVEWTFAGARPRGVIGYGTIAPNAPKRLHRLLALETLLTGVAPWPASTEAIDLYRILQPLGDIERYLFEDWRNGAITVTGGTCITAVYSRPGESYILLGNTDPDTKMVTVRVDPSKLPCPLTEIGAGEMFAGSDRSALDARGLAGSGVKVTVPGDSAVMVRMK